MCRDRCSASCPSERSGSRVPFFARARRSPSADVDVMLRVTGSGSPLEAPDIARSDAPGHVRSTTMVLAVALIEVTDAAAFEAAYLDARKLLITTPGCRSVRMARGIESPARFALLVEW